MTSRPMHELRSEALAASQRGDLIHARNALYAALGHTVAREEEYVACTNDMKAVLSRLGDARAALSVDWYAGNERTQKPMLPAVPPIDRARTLYAWAERSTAKDRARTLFGMAADEYESAGLVARAAVAREKAEDFARARALWSRLAQVLSGAGTDLYAAGLARFNLARTAKRTGDAAQAREATVASVHLLEEAADRYETIGQRERAFDCYQVLIAVGREANEFEHVLEGYVNVIRILREDHLRYYALQSYEEALDAAEKQGEASAAATLARELAAYARKEGLTPISNFGMLAQARLWQEVAALAERRGSPPEISENALLAAIMAFGEAGQFQKIQSIYAALAALPLNTERRGHYAKARGRYDGAADLRIEASPLPAHLRHEVGFPEVWHVDLIEWEQRGSASEACADIILDASTWSEVTRRRAVLARLTALSLDGHLASGPTADQSTTMTLASTLADQLSHVELYTILSSLEQMATRPEPQIRAAVMRALSRFLYKRTFITLRQGLADKEGAVIEEAARSLEELRFPHAFDPLQRIYRESQNPKVRASTLRALAKIDTLEVAEMLLSVIEHDGAAERQAAVDSLKRARGTKFVDLAKTQFPRLSGQGQSAVREVLQVRGMTA
jgi:tetratricopeptide (TPR) repeat protein